MEIAIFTASAFGLIAAVVCVYGMLFADGADGWERLVCLVLAAIFVILSIHGLGWW
jgi:hypothetical protein